ncbi:hypothetical protein PTT_17105 [Pyrenophora teres f. teres 0-1]|uniref:Uncharacterized protein n=1 Tax=Pyrenophora teres f. teres (strain 0-1) TaxID=861557 RepID=E3S3N0_PYRTT|nr:hypothetical protein PTT_17105 [Pyrenophora teres f. teres 0-1]
MSRFDGYKAIPISAPPAVAPVPAIIQSTATATYTTWLFENTTTLCTSPNLALANLEAAFESSFENRLEVQQLLLTTIELNNGDVVLATFGIQNVGIQRVGVQELHGVHIDWCS